MLGRSIICLSSFELVIQIRYFGCRKKVGLFAGRYPCCCQSEILWCCRCWAPKINHRRCFMCSFQCFFQLPNKINKSCPSHCCYFGRRCLFWRRLEPGDDHRPGPGPLARRWAKREPDLSPQRRRAMGDLGHGAKVGETLKFCSRVVAGAIGLNLVQTKLQLHQERSEVHSALQGSSCCSAQRSSH